MKFKVHWIIDGIAEIEGESKEDAEKKLQESLEDYVKNSEDLMNKFIAKSIQGTAYLEGEKDNEIQDENEKKEEIVTVQIAGLIARRILAFANRLDYLNLGERFGLIRFGSRVDVYLPSYYEPTVELGQKVTAGESIIAS